MKTSKILKMARPLIKDAEFICHAVENTMYLPKSKVQYSDADRVRSMISKRLDGNYTLNSWLERNYNINPEDMSDKKYNKMMYETRLAWVDSMIAEFKAKGD